MGFIASHAQSPLWTLSLGFFFLQNAHPEHGVCPAPSLLPQTVTSAKFRPVSPPGAAANPSPYEYHHILR